MNRAGFPQPRGPPAFTIRYQIENPRYQVQNAQINYYYHFPNQIQLAQCVNPSHQTLQPQNYFQQRQGLPIKINNQVKVITNQTIQPPQLIQAYQIPPSYSQQTRHCQHAAQQPQICYQHSHKISGEQKFQQTPQKKETIPQNQSQNQNKPIFEEERSSSPVQKRTNSQYRQRELIEFTKEYDGKIYRGQGYEPNIRQGKGVLTQNDKQIYSGDWKNNEYHGYGELINIESELLTTPYDYRDFEMLKNGWLCYEGSFNKGKMHGEGILYLSNGEKLNGNFIDGDVDGEGIYTTMDEIDLRGVWKKGILVE